MDVFFLAAALICEQANTVKVTKIIIPHVMSLKECQKLEKSKALNKHFVVIKEKDCQEALICINVGWKGPK